MMVSSYFSDSSAAQDFIVCFFSFSMTLLTQIKLLIVKSFMSNQVVSCHAILMKTRKQYCLNVILLY